MQILETEHLKLLPFTLELKKTLVADRALFAEKIGVQVPDSWPGPDLADALSFFIKVMENDPTGRVWDGIIIHTADQVAIGSIGFHGEPDEAGALELGYSIIPQYRGRGYATEMAQSIIDWAFRTQRIEAIVAECLDDNIGSIKVLERVGMQRLAPDGNMLKWRLQALKERIGAEK